MTPLTALARYVARQHHVVSWAELRALGWSADGIKHLVASRRLFPVYRGVYVFGRRSLSQHGWWMAAVLAAPAGAALSHASAAVLWSLLERDDGPHVIVGAARTNRGPRGIHVHRSSDFVEDDVERDYGIRVTKVLRTLRDLARSGLSDRSLDAAVRQAGRLHHADLQELSGVPRLGKVVRLYDPLLDLTESQLESLFLGMCARYRLPMPEPQFVTGRYRCDFVWHAYRLIVECQSRRWHDNDVNFVADRQKVRHARRIGYDLLPFTWAEVRYEPASVAAEIREALSARAHLGVL